MEPEAAKAAFAATIAETLRSFGMAAQESERSAASMLFGPRVAPTAVSVDALASAGHTAATLVAQQIAKEAAEFHAAGESCTEVVRDFRSPDPISAAPPAANFGFTTGCDAFGCLRCTDSALSCSRCGEARYCSTACLAKCWRETSLEELLPRVAGLFESLKAHGVLPGHTAWESHKTFCGKLRAAPRPLRLMC